MNTIGRSYGAVLNDNGHYWQIIWCCAIWQWTLLADHMVLCYLTMNTIGRSYGVVLFHNEHYWQNIWCCAIGDNWTMNTIGRTYGVVLFDNEPYWQNIWCCAIWQWTPLAEHRVCYLTINTTGRTYGVVLVDNEHYWQNIWCCAIWQWTLLADHLVPCYLTMDTIGRSYGVVLFDNEHYWQIIWCCAIWQWTLLADHMVLCYLTTNHTQLVLLNWPRGTASSSWICGCRWLNGNQMVVKSEWSEWVIKVNELSRTSRSIYAVQSYPKHWNWYIPSYKNLNGNKQT